MVDFSELENYIDRWGLESPADRLRQRVDSTLDELKDFYNAVSPRTEEIIEYLNQFHINEIPEKDRPLAWMILALCEVDDAIHMWKAANLDYISDPVHWRTKTSFVDYR